MSIDRGWLPEPDEDEPYLRPQTLMMCQAHGDAIWYEKIMSHLKMPEVPNELHGDIPS